MADAAQPHALTFVREGLDPGFLTCLRATADALDSSITNQQTSEATRIVTTHAIEGVVSEGRAALQVVNAIVEATLRGNAPLNGQWSATKQYGGSHA